MTNEFRVMVTGSRDWDDERKILSALLLAEYALAWGVSASFTLVTGRCPTGADALAEAMALERGWTIDPYPADWERYGKPAGPIRNKEMVDTGPDVVIAFQRDNSKGTDNAVKLARAALIPVFLWSA